MPPHPLEPACHTDTGPSHFSGPPSLPEGVLVEVGWRTSSRVTASQDHLFSGFLIT